MRTFPPSHPPPAPLPPAFLGPPVGGAYPAAPAQRSSRTTLWIVLGVFATGLCVLVCGLAGAGMLLEQKSARAAPHPNDAMRPEDTGWPMEFRADGVRARVFAERSSAGRIQTIGISVHAPKPFLELGASTFVFEVCRLVDGQRSRWRCDTQKLFVDPAKKDQKDGVRSFTVTDGPGVYQARLVEFGTFGADDKVYSSATFEVR